MYHKIHFGVWASQGTEEQIVPSCHCDTREFVNINWTNVMSDKARQEIWINASFPYKYDRIIRLINLSLTWEGIGFQWLTACLLAYFYWTGWIFRNWSFRIEYLVPPQSLISLKSRGLKLARIPKLAIILFHILTQWRRYISLDFLFTSGVMWRSYFK